MSTQNEKPDQTGSSEELREQLSRLDQENHELKRLLNTNPDTGLPIRRLFERRLQARVQMGGGSCGVAVIRLDAAYDRIKDNRDPSKALLVKSILRIRRVLGENIYQSDRADEFLCLLQSDVSAEKFRQLLERVVAAIAARHEPPADDVNFGCHVGVALADADTRGPQELMWKAAMALNEARETGQRILYYSQELGDRTRTREELEADLRDQLRKGFSHFYLLFQPIVNPEGTIVAAEILVRWKHPERGLVPPDVFIPMSEDNGFIRHIGQWALYQSLHTLVDLRQMGFRGYFSVNTSPLQFNQPDLVERVKGILDNHQLHGRVLQLELTEGALLQNTDEVTHKVAELRQLGVRFAIDDFGTGYSSLRYLQDFPVDTIKIDRSFVQGAPEHPNRQEIIRTIQFMARSLKIQTQAEGVETQAEHDFLLQQGCNTMQGYYYSPPVDVNRFSQLITSGRKLPT
ncbi:putative bifunctional diguanylate cyclase/phosphodiesterase [Spirochaeta africana]|uniref:putative bifunctional diguanylate cyclase/phosphodiesterase n=1 Tax=Spirochaeta africana TaxID=46355 RepID=UPI00024732AB|nr:bifunctional diguanylate cyclase/phosphodiesterase [Spirochaeta africana]